MGQLSSKILEDLGSLLTNLRELCNIVKHHLYISRKEFHILEKLCGGAETGILRLLDYYESPAQSVIVTEFLHGN